MNMWVKHYILSPSVRIPVNPVCALRYFLYADNSDRVSATALNFEDYSHRTLNVTFNSSCWYGIAELCFEGLVSMNLRAQQENYSREII